MRPRAPARDRRGGTSAASCGPQASSRAYSAGASTGGSATLAVMRAKALSTRGSAALVLMVALVVHARTIAFGFTGLDDRDLVVDDQAFLANPASLLRIFGRS